MVLRRILPAEERIVAQRAQLRFIVSPAEAIAIHLRHRHVGPRHRAASGRGHRPRDLTGGNYETEARDWLLRGPAPMHVVMVSVVV